MFMKCDILMKLSIMYFDNMLKAFDIQEMSFQGKVI